MGQRIIIVAEIKQKDKMVRVAYHKQWGYGYRGARACLGLLMTEFFRPKIGEEITSDSYKEHLSHPPNATLSEYFTDEELRQYEKPDGEIDMANVIAAHDNNNGGIYLQINLDEYGNYIADSRIRFYRGLEEELPETEYGEPATAGERIDMADYLVFHREGDALPPLLLSFQFEGIKVD